MFTKPSFANDLTIVGHVFGVAMDIMGNRELVASDFMPEPCDWCGDMTSFVISNKSDLSETPCCNRCWGRLTLTVSMALAEASSYAAKRRLKWFALGWLFGGLIVFLIMKGFEWKR